MSYKIKKIAEYPYNDYYVYGPYINKQNGYKFEYMRLMNIKTNELVHITREKYLLGIRDKIKYMPKQRKIFSVKKIAEFPYNDCYIYGPYIGKNYFKLIQLKNIQTNKSTTMSYNKYLLAVKNNIKCDKEAIIFNKDKSEIKAEYPYDNYYIYGPYNCRGNKYISIRLKHCITNEAKEISYKNYLMEVKLKRFITKQERVVFIDGNASNYDRNNLKLDEYGVKNIVEFKCPECGNIFTRYVGNSSLKRTHHRFTSCSNECKYKIIAKLKVYKRNKRKLNRLLANNVFNINFTYPNTQENIKSNVISNIDTLNIQQKEVNHGTYSI